MTYTATITSKRQLTIPVAIFKELGFTIGEKVILIQEDEGIKIKSQRALLRKLAGSVKVSKRFKGLTPDQMIEKARDEYFKKYALR